MLVLALKLGCTCRVKCPGGVGRGRRLCDPSQKGGCIAALYCLLPCLACAPVPRLVVTVKQGGTRELMWEGEEKSPERVGK